jgi:cytochrome o ubiquinol oxidase operon protein cyoD
MSRLTDRGPESTEERERGTTRSYVVGFALSLLFTIVPYTLVSQHLMTGSGILAVILSIAALQMIIQVVFFLHLGRERRPRWQLYFLLGTIVGVLTVVVGSIFIMAHLHDNMNGLAITQKLAQDEGIAQVSGVKTGACQEIGASHIVTINGGKVDVLHTDARLCDTLTFVNNDKPTREIAFGPHDNHETYGGQTILNISARHPETITLNQAGTYTFHDHLDTDVAGSFTVSP